MGLLFAKPATITEAASTSLDEVGFRAAGSSTTRLGFRQLSDHKRRLAQRESVRLYHINPVANRTLRIYRSFLAGDGFKLTAFNPEVAAVLEEFWTSPRSSLERNHRSYARDYLLLGEGIHPVVDDDFGNVTIGYIDPDSVANILRDPRNHALLSTVMVSNGGVTPEPLRIVRPQEDLTEPDVGLLTGDVFAWLFDRVAASSRGIPLLLPALDWLTGFDQILWEMLERQKALRAYFWHVQVDGGIQQVREAKEMMGTGPPMSGSVRYTTKAIDVKAESPQLGAHEDVAGARFQLRHLANATGLSPHWLSEPEDANRSTADSMDVPVVRNLADVQNEWTLNMRDVGRYVVDRKVAAGLLDATVELHNAKGEPVGKQVPARDTVRVMVPKITDDRIQEAAQSLAAVASAFVQLDMLDVITPSVAQQVVWGLLPSIGVPPEELPDPDDLKNEPASEQRQKLVEALLAFDR